MQFTWSNQEDNAEVCMSSPEFRELAAVFVTPNQLCKFITLFSISGDAISDAWYEVLHYSLFAQGFQVVTSLLLLHSSLDKNMICASTHQIFVLAIS